jgi:hypothetical protein
MEILAICIMYKYTYGTAEPVCTVAEMMSPVICHRREFAKVIGKRGRQRKQQPAQASFAVLYRESERLGLAAWLERQGGKRNAGH